MRISHKKGLPHRNIIKSPSKKKKKKKKEKKRKKEKERKTNGRQTPIEALKVSQLPTQTTSASAESRLHGLMNVESSIVTNAPSYRNH